WPKPVHHRCWRTPHPALPLAGSRAPAGRARWLLRSPNRKKSGDLAGPCRLAGISAFIICDRRKAGRRPAIRGAIASMAGLSLAERAKLSLLLGRRGVRVLAGRLRGHPLIRFSFMSRRADRLLIAPQDLRTADATRASEIYAGRFSFAGKVVISDG